MNATQSDHAYHLALDGIPSMYATLGSIVSLLIIVACMILFPKIHTICKHCLRETKRRNYCVLFHFYEEHTPVAFIDKNLQTPP
jgi:hypothetical protein